MEGYNTKLVAERIKICRNAKDLSQEELANKLGKSRTNIVNYEAGRTTLPGSVIVDLSEIFNVSTDYLLGLSEDPHPNNPDLHIQRLHRLKQNVSEEKWDRAMKILNLSFMEEFDDTNEEEEDL